MELVKEEKGGGTHDHAQLEGDPEKGTTGTTESASTGTHVHIERDGGSGATTTPEREEQEDSPTEISTVTSV